MRKEYVVLQVAALQAGSPNVLVTMAEARFLKPAAERSGWDDPFPTRRVRYGSEFYTTTIMDYNEFLSSGLQVGDRVTMEVKRSEQGKLESAQLTGQSTLE